LSASDDLNCVFLHLLRIRRCVTEEQAVKVSLDRLPDVRAGSRSRWHMAGISRCMSAVEVFREIWSQSLLNADLPGISTLNFSLTSTRGSHCAAGPISNSLF
jgi:hypothetical protein